MISNRKVYYISAYFYLIPHLYSETLINSVNEPKGFLFYIVYNDFEHIYQEAEFVNLRYHNHYTGILFAMLQFLLIMLALSTSRPIL